MSTIDRLMLRLEVQELMDRYAAAIDNDRIETWPGFFTEDGFYEIISRENEEAGLPAPVVQCANAAMMRDRVVALRHANIYEKPQYRHLLSALVATMEPDGTIRAESNYIVVNTSQEGSSSVYQAGRYADLLTRTAEGLKFRVRRCIYDTLRVQTLLAFPI